MTHSLFGGRAALGLLLGLLLMGIGAAPEARAQEFGRIGEVQTNAAYFYYAQPGEATVQVSLWGMPQPGIYEVPDSTALDRLLTMAGGVNMQTRQENRKPPRITVRLYRDGREESGPLVEARLEDILKGRIESPELREGDRVVVETIQPTSFTWQDGLSIVSTAASLSLLILRILRFSD
jgi:hypothetical protein